MASGFLFFAYGDMADQAHMEGVHPLADLMGPAKAVDHRFTFSPRGEANLVPEPGASAAGTLWLVPAEVMEAMDATAAEKGFRRAVIFIVSPAGPKVPATVYHDPDAPDGPPSEEALAGALAAAKAMKLDKRFVRELKAFSA